MRAVAVRSSIFFITLLAPCLAQARTNYQPAPPLTSPCNCDSINGTCDQNTCTIVCLPGFFDCDQDLTNGCECGSDANNACMTSTACNGASCGSVTINAGVSCGASSASCVIDGTCDSNGICVGTPAPDNTPCDNPPNCSTPTGQCNNGKCACTTGPPQDLSTVSSGDMGSQGGGTAQGCACDLTPAAGGSSLFVLVAFGMLALALRRRRQ
jgi:MYXO-CTERM domain-containing protein